MAKIADEVMDDDYDIISKYVVDPVGRWLDRLGYLELLTGASNYQREVIDCYNYTSTNIREICSQMREYDSRYGQYISNYANQADNVYRLTAALAECLDVNSSEYSSEDPVSNRITSFGSKWVKGSDGNLVRISDLRSSTELAYRNEYNSINLTNDEIVEFCNNSNSVTLFEDYTDYIFDIEMDWGALEIVFLSAGIVLYKGVEITVDELLSEFTQEGYTDKIVREELDKIISSVIETNSTVQTVVKSHDMAVETVESLISDYMEDENKNSTFKSFVEAIGGMSAVKELAETCPELLDYLFSDYSKGLEIIENIAETCDISGSSEMCNAIDRLRQEYSSKWIGLLQKVKDFSIDTITSLAKKDIEEWIKDEIGDTSVLLSVIDITRLEDKTDCWQKLVVLREIAYQIQDGYEDAINVVRSGNYTEEELTYAENMFNMLKQITTSVYETYRDMCDDPSKQIWCNEQIAKISRISMEKTNESLEFKE